MNIKDIKLKFWPFDKGARVKLEWIGAPFRYEKKVVMPVYFSGKVNGYYTTEKLIVDWTVLTSLIIQHYYVDGVITKPILPNQTEEIIITINPNYVGYFEQNYSIRGTNHMETSQTFVIKYNGERFYLPLIEVLRGIVAPNAFLLNCLFEMNSFPLYFTEQYEPDLLRLHFISSYNAKYLKNEYLNHLVWLLMNNNVRKVYENMSSNFHFNNSIKFEWPFQTPIKLKLRVKKTATGYTVLNIKAMLEKELQISNLEITHPSLVRHEKSNEPRKRIILPLSNSGEYEADSTVDGRTNEFDEVVTENLTHDYIDTLLITRQRNVLSKQRNGIDANTKKTVKTDANNRSMGDIGGTNILRGLEVKALENTYVNGELAVFKEVLNELLRAHSVESVEAYIGELTDIGDRSFAFLDDGITPRKYIVAYINLRIGKEVALIEVERAGRSVSTLIITSLNSSSVRQYIEHLLNYIILSSGSWLKEGLMKWEKNLAIYKVKHTTGFKQSLLNTILAI
ncbi:MAG: Tn7-like element transposition protein TnsE [Solibacillus sp.]|uniref:Tn7-like element transposition protein TnsE n=1 Tax=Solibacillus sp. TaxID=1909654 RepID=UPI0033158350